MRSHGPTHHPLFRGNSKMKISKPVWGYLSLFFLMVFVGGLFWAPAITWVAFPLLGICISYAVAPEPKYHSGGSVSGGFVNINEHRLLGEVDMKFLGEPGTTHRRKYRDSDVIIKVPPPRLRPAPPNVRVKILEDEHTALRQCRYKREVHARLRAKDAYLTAERLRGFGVSTAASRVWTQVAQRRIRTEKLLCERKGIAQPLHPDTGLTRAEAQNQRFVGIGEAHRRAFFKWSWHLFGYNKTLEPLWRRLLDQRERMQARAAVMS